MMLFNTVVIVDLGDGNETTHKPSGTLEGVSLRKHPFPFRMPIDISSCLRRIAGVVENVAESLQRILNPMKGSIAIACGG